MPTFKHKKKKVRNEREMILVKCTFLGDQKSGKSTLLEILEGNPFSEEYDETIGVDFKAFDFWHTTLIPESFIKCQVFDLGGSKSWGTIRKSYYHDKNFILLACDLSNENFIESLKSWIEDILKRIDTLPTIHIIVTKVDLIEDKNVIESKLNEIYTAIINAFSLRDTKVYLTSAKESSAYEINFDENGAPRPDLENKIKNMLINLVLEEKLMQDTTPREKTSLVKSENSVNEKNNQTSLDQLKQTLMSKISAITNQEVNKALMALYNDLVKEMDAQAINQKIPNQKTPLISATNGPLATAFQETIKVIDSCTDKNKNLSEKLKCVQQFKLIFSPSSSFGKFFKPAAVVASAFVGALVGGILGFAVGLLAGAWSGPGAFLTGMVGLAAGAKNGWAIGTAAASGALSLGAGVGSRNFIFKKSKREKLVSNFDKTFKSVVRSGSESLLLEKPDPIGSLDSDRKSYEEPTSAYLSIVKQLSHKKPYEGPANTCSIFNRKLSPEEERKQRENFNKFTTERARGIRIRYLNQLGFQNANLSSGAFDPDPDSRQHSVIKR